jgi:hypothetical protein
MSDKLSDFVRQHTRVRQIFGTLMDNIHQVYEGADLTLGETAENSHTLVRMPDERRAGVLVNDCWPLNLKGGGA